MGTGTGPLCAQPRCVLRRALQRAAHVEDALQCAETQLSTRAQGPKNPYFVDGVTPGMRNHLGGGIERTHIADFHFEDQYQTFNTVGYAMDPGELNLT